MRKLRLTKIIADFFFFLGYYFVNILVKRQFPAHLVDIEFLGRKFSFLFENLVELIKYCAVFWYKLF